MNHRTLQTVSRWRAQYNPLRGLTFQRAVSLLEEGERGAYADLQWTYRFIEKRDAVLRALVELRTSAIKKLDWDIKTVDCGDDAAKQATAEKQAAALRLAYERIGNLKEAVAFLALAQFRGYAHLEKVYAGDNPAAGVVALQPVPQWHWCRDTLYGPWLYNAEAASTNRGTPIEERHFIIREVERLNGFLDALRDQGKPFKILKTYQAVEPVAGRRVGLEILRDFPARKSIDAIFMVNDGGGLSVVDVLANAGRNEIAVASVDGDPQSVENIRTQRLTRIDSAQFCGPLGATAIRTAYAVARGQKVASQILVPVFPITAETLARYPGWLGPVPASFEKPWPAKQRVWKGELTEVKR